MVLVDGKPSTDKVNVYRAAVNQPTFNGDVADEMKVRTEHINML